MASREELKIKKEITSQALIQAALELSAEGGYASLSLRSVARKAGIAPTSFYRHFRDMDELGLTIVDQATVLLHKRLNEAISKMMLQTDQRTASFEQLPEIFDKLMTPFVDTFMACFEKNRLLMNLFLQERTGASQALRDSIFNEVKKITNELSLHLEKIDIMLGKCFKDVNFVAKTMMSILLFSGLEMLVGNASEKENQSARTIKTLTLLLLGDSMLKGK